VVAVWPFRFVATMPTVEECKICAATTELLRLNADTSFHHATVLLRISRSFSPLGLRGILVLDLCNGISGFAKSNQHSLGEMNTFFVTFRDLLPRRAVPRTGMINESGFDGACYDDKGVF
jgi:hypothetical protein